MRNEECALAYTSEFHLKVKIFLNVALRESANSSFLIPNYYDSTRFPSKSQVLTTTFQDAENKNFILF